MDRHLEILFWLCVVIGIVMVLKSFSQPRLALEGFSQSRPFESRENEHIYEPFYVSMYDRLHNTRQQSKFDMYHVIKLTQPSDNSTFLDIGSGTGYLVHRLEQKGYRAFGIDASEIMVDHATKKYPQSEFKCGDAKQTMEFEPDTFSHILCTYFTVYEIGDRELFLKNCARWLKTGGYLILHLVDPVEYNPIIPLAKIHNGTNIQSTTRDRITNTKLDFNGITYKNKMILENETARIKESFIDRKSKHVKQYERTLKMDTKKSWIERAKAYGFVVKGIVNYTEYNGDVHQYLYILEKIDV